MNEPMQTAVVLQGVEVGWLFIACLIFIVAMALVAFLLAVVLASEPKACEHCGREKEFVGVHRDKGPYCTSTECPAYLAKLEKLKETLKK